MLTDARPPRDQRGTLEWTLVAGLVAIFGANALGAVFEPASYQHILEASPITRMVGLDEHEWATVLIAINDAGMAFGLLAASLCGRTRRMLALAGAWLAIAAVLKVTACFA